MRREMLRALGELKRRIERGEVRAIACVAIAASDEDEGVLFAIGETEGGDKEWLDILDELKEHVLSGKVLPPPDGPGDDHGAN